MPAAADQFGWVQIVSGDLLLQMAAADAIGGEFAMTRGDGLGFSPTPAGPPITALTAGPEGADLLWFALS